MSNPKVYVANFEGVKLPYIKQEGSGAPLFIIEALAKAFGVSPASGYWYRKDLLDYTSKHRLKAGQQKMRMLHVKGVFLLLGKRQPVWEQEFRDKFGAFISPSFPEIPKPIRPDNLPADLDLATLHERQDVMDGKLDKLLELVGAPTAASIRAPKLIPIRGTKEVVRVPSRADFLFMNLSKAHDHGESMSVLRGEPIYSHVEGYRTYKEMLAAAGLDIFINTPRGRNLSRIMARLAQKHGITYYLVVDTMRYHQQRGDESRRFHMDSYRINAYPQELWAVVEPIAQRYLDELSIV